VPGEIAVLYQDAHLVVVDKPHFLAVLPRGRHLHETVLVRAKKQLGLSTLVPMHRLDRETAGVLVLLIQPETRNAYQSLLRTGQVRKIYEAVAPWQPSFERPQHYGSRIEPQAGARFMQMQTVPGPPNAHTQIELLQRLTGAASGLAHYRLQPFTGRKHQLRAQLCALGMPIVGDRIYPVLWPETAPGVPEDFSQPLQLLARAVSFTDPVTGAARCFKSRQTLASVAGGGSVQALP
jgi:tRNA pseudouridine32 synthase/23S rRNA pseudouridine746 synthase